MTANDGQLRRQSLTKSEYEILTAAG